LAYITTVNVATCTCELPFQEQKLHVLRKWYMEEFAYKRQD